MTIYRGRRVPASPSIAATLPATLLVLPLLLGSALASTTALGQGMGDVKIETIEVAGSVSMLVGAGGNIGVSVGDDGVFMIDDQFAPLTDRILAAVAKLTEKPVRFLVNTHWHADHTGGNENLGKSGVIIVAHENVRARLSRDQFIEAFNSTVPASPPEALPVVTFTDTVTFHWNDDEIRVFHVAPAHTDGDAIIHFRKSNVLHMGDTYFNGMYPFIDVGSGGSIDGMIAAVKRVLPLCDRDTKIIPGHGPLSGTTELRSYLRMLETARGAIARLVAEGRSRDAVIAAKPTRDLDGDWGGGFMQPDVWVGIVYDGLAKAGKGMKQ